MIPEVPNSYDQVPYPSHPYPLTHPDWLATVGTLFGMNPPPADRCRVLELGCGSGGNLLPMAAALPDSTFVGIDLSARMIAEGQAMLELAGLRNVELRRASILDVVDDDGVFDYVICGGVFSWVPRPVQDKILAICSRNLTPNGIAYVSYNAYPGGHQMALLRDMMLFSARLSSEPSTQIASARAMAELLTRWPSQMFGPCLTKFVELLRTRPDGLIYHDFLAPTNERFYLLDFIERAQTAGLRFLGDSELHLMFSDQLAPDDVRAALAELAPTVELREQYIDFLRNRMFRQTLLCRQDVPLQHRVEASALRALHFGGLFHPEPQGVSSGAERTFRTEGGLEVTTRSPVGAAALLRLREAWPQVVSYAELATAARAHAGTRIDAAEAERRLAETLWHSFMCGLLQLRVAPDRFCLAVGERPRATTLARLQASVGPEVTNLRHRRLELEPLPRRVLIELDGSSDRAQLVDRLAATAPKLVGRDVEANVDAALRTVAVEGLLVR